MEKCQEVWPSAGRDFYEKLEKLERMPHRSYPLADARERRLCIQWILRACDDYGFNKSTGTLAAKLFEVFLLNARVSPAAKDLSLKTLVVKVAQGLIDPQKHKESSICELICIVIIAVSAKKVEPKESAPFLGDFDENFSFSELMAMETRVLNILQWNLSYSTVYDFTAYWEQFLPKGIDRKKFTAILEEAVTVSAPEHNFAFFRPSILAAGTTLFAFSALQISSKEWEAKLETHLGEAVGDALTARDQIADLLADQYPHAVSAVMRPESPDQVTGLPAALTASTQQIPARPQGIKRPVAQRNGVPHHIQGSLEREDVKRVRMDPA